jgi:zinc transport system ATP-binding protein
MTKAIVAKFSNISKNFLSDQVLNDISFNINENEIVTLIGPNGSGKTTLVRILLGVLKQDTGTIWTQENLRMGYVPQKVHIDASLPITVEFFLKHANQKVDLAYFDELSQELKITKILQKPIQKISGGELQRVLLTRALLFKPKLLILDEPAQGVDITGQEELYQLISQIRNQHNCSVLMVSHDLHLVMASTDKVVCLNQHICCSGAPSDVTQHPEYLKLFGGSLAHPELALYTHQHDHQHDVHGDVKHESCDHG